jgi:DNA-binding MarR family transcriptional regulator
MGFGESTPPEGLSDYSGFLLNWAAASSKRKFEEALEGIGLRLHQFALMNVVAGSPGRTQQELTQLTHIDPSTMVQTLDQLAEAGLAERRPHESDRRKHTVHLTTEGKRKLRSARGVARKSAEETFGRLDPGEREELHRLLRKMTGVDG